MTPSAIDEMASRREAWKTLPPSTLYPVKEARFEKYLPPQVDGHERALAQEGQASIIIDNGEQWSFTVKSPQSPMLTQVLLLRLLVGSRRVVL